MRGFLRFFARRQMVVYSAKGIWKVPIEGGEPVRLIDGEAMYPAISPDGRWIAYSYDDKEPTPPQGVAIAELEGGRPATRFDATTSSIRRDADGHSLLYTKNEMASIILKAADCGRTPTQITHLAAI